MIDAAASPVHHQFPARHNPAPVLRYYVRRPRDTDPNSRQVVDLARETYSSRYNADKLMRESRGIPSGPTRRSPSRQYDDANGHTTIFDIQRRTTTALARVRHKQAVRDSLKTASTSRSYNNPNKRASPQKDVAEVCYKSNLNTRASPQREFAEKSSKTSALLNLRIDRNKEQKCHTPFPKEGVSKNTLPPTNKNSADDNGIGVRLASIDEKESKRQFYTSQDDTRTRRPSGTNGIRLPCNLKPATKNVVVSDENVQDKLGDNSNENIDAIPQKKVKFKLQTSCHSNSTSGDRPTSSQSKHLKKDPIVTMRDHALRSTENIPKTIEESKQIKNSRRASTPVEKKPPTIENAMSTFKQILKRIDDKVAPEKENFHFSPNPSSFQPKHRNLPRPPSSHNNSPTTRMLRRAGVDVSRSKNVDSPSMNLHNMYGHQLTYQSGDSYYKMNCAKMEPKGNGSPRKIAPLTQKNIEELTLKWLAIMEEENKMTKTNTSVIQLDPRVQIWVNEVGPDERLVDVKGDVIRDYLAGLPIVHPQPV